MSATSKQPRQLDTPYGPACAHVEQVADAAGAVILGHGAGGGIATPDLQAAARAATSTGYTAVLVEQPYRVAGRRAQPPAAHLDAAWIAVNRALELPPGRLVLGGRSAGARVACRTAAELGADAVLCLAFPVHPPGKADDPLKSRLGELEAVSVPVLVVQGDNDPFGRPPAGPGRQVAVVPGAHSFRLTDQIEPAVAAWLAALR